jgi:CheY-like chemotaxis protein
MLFTGPSRLIPGDRFMSQKPTYEELVRRIHHLETQIKKNALDSDVGGSTTSKLKDFENPKRPGEISRDAKKMLQLVMDIGLSMHNDSDTRNKMLEAGASAYLTKTGSPSTLIDTINRVYAEIK